MENLQDIIQRFEHDQISFDEAKAAILASTGKEVDEYALRNYWRSESLNSFARRLAQSPAEIPLDDGDVAKLVKELFENLNDDAIVEANCEALEKRFAKPPGTVSDWIF
ncbi:MAG: hypothetical protein AAF570_10170, partial [Bacteroidota bacterium]